MKTHHDWGLEQETQRYDDELFQHCVAIDAAPNSHRGTIGNQTFQ